MDQDPRELLELLRCVECGDSTLAIEPSTGELLKRYGPSMMRCAVCKAEYPVTPDGIPIVWTRSIRDSLLRTGGSSDAISANIFVYDKISDDYAAHTRTSTESRVRVLAACDWLLKRAKTPQRRPLRHLDWGCGPGHVIGWLAGKGLVQVGLDVSLRNLRNTRRRTGALVVLGDAQKMPFRNGVFDVVTEASVLHHVERWRDAITEACRVCSGVCGVMLDAEPTRDQMDWSRLATKLFNLRFYVYHGLSYAMKSMYKFRNLELARKDYWNAEIHHQPGTGFDLNLVDETFRSAGYGARILRSPTPGLGEGANPSWQMIVLHALSGHNPWNPKFGAMLVLGVADERTP